MAEGVEESKQMIADLKALSMAAQQASVATRGVQGATGNGGISAAGAFSGSGSSPTGFQNGSNGVNRKMSRAEDFVEEGEMGSTSRNSGRSFGTRKVRGAIRAGLGIYDLAANVDAINQFGIEQQKFEQELRQKTPLDQTILKAKNYAEKSKLGIDVLVSAARFTPVGPEARILGEIGRLAIEFGTEDVNKQKAMLDAGQIFSQDIKHGGQGVKVGAHDKYYDDRTGQQALNRYVEKNGFPDVEALKIAIQKTKEHNGEGLRLALLGDTARAQKEFDLANKEQDIAGIHLPGQGFGDPVHIFMRNEQAKLFYKNWARQSYGKSHWRIGD